MPGEARQVVLGMLVAEVVEQEERVEVPRGPEAEGAAELDPRALEGGAGLDDALDRSQRHCTSTATAPEFD
jgi:hypothetical protein